MEPVFGTHELDPDRPSLRLRSELVLRAQWLDSLSAGERSTLDSTPMAAVEQAFARWREEHPEAARVAREEAMAGEAAVAGSGGPRPA